MLLRSLALFVLLTTSTFALDATHLASIQPAMEQAVAAKAIEDEIPDGNLG